MNSPPSQPASDCADLIGADATLGGQSAGQRGRTNQWKSAKSKAQTRTRTKRTTVGSITMGRTQRSVKSKPPSTSESNPQTTAKLPLPHDQSRYESLQEVGRGGWGVVEKVVDRLLDREVAVKRITGEDVSTAEREQFFREAKLTSQLQHPGIVPVHELSESEDAFYVMKLLDGETLQDCIDHCHASLATNDLSPHHLGILLEPLLQRFVDVCNAVAYAHGRGIIHRDLKPANIMVGNFGETVILDWGLACRWEEINEATHATSTADQSMSHLAVGTPKYMPPEQARGDQELVGPASDIYSLGVILYQIIGGTHPYQGTTLVEVLDEVKSGRHQPLIYVRPNSPRPLASIVEKAIAAKPSDRYQTAEHLAADVRRFIAGDAVSVHRESILDRSARWCHGHRSLAVTMLCSAAILLVAAISFSVTIHRAHQSERRARLRAEKEHQSAIARMTQARDATADWLIDVSGSLEAYPELQPLREKLLERAIHNKDKKPQNF